MLYYVRLIGGWVFRTFRGSAGDAIHYAGQLIICVGYSQDSFAELFSSIERHLGDQRGMDSVASALTASTSGKISSTLNVETGVFG